jgi:hypothetical protein
VAAGAWRLNAVCRVPAEDFDRHCEEHRSHTDYHGDADRILPRRDVTQAGQLIKHVTFAEPRRSTRPCWTHAVVNAGWSLCGW